MMHKTNAHWEAGATPGPELIARVGRMIGEMAEARVLRAAEGLRASSQGVRLRFSGGRRTVTPGPFTGSKELPASFTILRLESLEQAIEWASRFARVVGDVEIDIRPVTEPWDIGMAAKPDGLTTRRFMAIRKADARTEAGSPLTPNQVAAMATLVEDMTKAGVLLAAEEFQRSAKGARLEFSRGKHTITDGPFTESKELIAGFVILEAQSLQEMLGWAPRYAAAVGDVELDILPLVERPDALPPR
jgi:hypothetical protein